MSSHIPEDTPPNPRTRTAMWARFGIFTALVLGGLAIEAKPLRDAFTLLASPAAYFADPPAIGFHVTITAGLVAYLLASGYALAAHTRLPLVAHVGALGATALAVIAAAMPTPPAAERFETLVQAPPHLQLPFAMETVAGCLATKAKTQPPASLGTETVETCLTLGGVRLVSTLLRHGRPIPIPFDFQVDPPEPYPPDISRLEPGMLLIRITHARGQSTTGIVEARATTIGAYPAGPTVFVRDTSGAIAVIAREF